MTERAGTIARTRCLVTGGAGFIGSHLVEALVQRGAQVRVMDNLSTGKRENLQPVAKDVEFLEGDITHSEDCRRACEGMECVFHQAARVSVLESFAQPIATHETNALGTLGLLCAARDAGCRRVVYAGSASAYGETEVLPTHEQVPPQPMSPYAISKYVGELYCRLFSQSYGLDTVVLRYFNIFGPRQDPRSPYSGVIAQFAFGLATGKDLTIYGDGEQTRDLVPVENVVAANLAAATAPEAVGKVMNIGCGQRLTINRLACLMIEYVGSHAEIRYANPRSGDIRHSLADTTQAQDLLGYRVITPPEEGLRRTLAWYQNVALPSQVPGETSGGDGSRP